MTIPLEAVPIGGAVDRDVTVDAIIPRRSPGSLRHQLDPGSSLLVTMAAGMRVGLLTDARSLELDVMVTVLDPGEVMPLPAVFDLVVDGELRSSVTASIRFDDLPGDASVGVEVWLPHRSVVELREVRVSEEGSGYGAND